MYAPVFDRTIAGMTHASNAKVTEMTCVSSGTIAGMTCAPSGKATGMTCASNDKSNAIYHVDNSIHLRPPAVVLI